MEKTRILLVDDHPALRHGLVEMFARTEDLEVCCEASNREQALEAAEKHRPDLAIVDITLGPGQASGLDLIKDLHNRGGKIPVLILSMHDEAIFAEKSLRAGARGYLMKQEPVRNILQAVRKIRDGGIFISEAINNALVLRGIGEKKDISGAPPVQDLTVREFEVLQLLGQGMQPKQIAEKLALGVKTVETHRHKMRIKLGFDTAAELTQFAIQWFHQDV